MPKIVSISAGGERLVAEAAEGISLMQAAANSMVKGILAECGGCLSWATYHVHVDEQWFGRLPPKKSLEEEMLAMSSEPSATSRLSCQIRLTPDLDGLTVRVPTTQG